MFGSLYQYTADFEKIVGRFNAASASKLLCVLDEISVSVDDKTSLDRLKALITQMDLLLEQKGVDPILIRTFTRFMLFTNHAQPIAVPTDCRRYFCLDADSVPQEERLTYFHSLHDTFRPEMGKHLFHFLMRRDITLGCCRDSRHSLATCAAAPLSDTSAEVCADVGGRQPNSSHLVADGFPCGLLPVVQGQLWWTRRRSMRSPVR